MTKPKPESEKLTAGRKTDTYTPEIAQEILDWVASGKTITSYCKKLGGKDGRPRSVSTIWGWRLKYPEFFERFKDAQDFGDYACEEEAQDIADSPDLMLTEIVDTTGDKDSKVQRTKDNVERSRLRVEARLRKVARRQGAKAKLQVSGDKESPLRIEQDLPPLTAEQVLEIARMKYDDDQA